MCPKIHAGNLKEPDYRWLDFLMSAWTSNKPLYEIINFHDLYDLHEICTENYKKYVIINNLDYKIIYKWLFFIIFWKYLIYLSTWEEVSHDPFGISFELLCWTEAGRVLAPSYTADFYVLMDSNHPRTIQYVSLYSTYMISQNMKYITLVYYVWCTLSLSLSPLTFLFIAYRLQLYIRQQNTW